MTTYLKPCKAILIINGENYDCSMTFKNVLLKHLKLLLFIKTILENKDNIYQQ